MPHNPETMRWPRPDKETVKKMYRAYGGNPGDGRMKTIMAKIDAAYDKVEGCDAVNSDK